MKVKETRHVPGGGFGGYTLETRVRKLAKDETPPADAEVVDDATPETDWQREANP